MWTKLDDAFPDHPKVLELVEAVGAEGPWVYVSALCFCGMHLTDGYIPTAKVRILLPNAKRALVVAAELVRLGLWTEVDGGYVIHDYLAYQPSADEINAKRAKNAAKLKKWRDEQAKLEAGSSDQS